MEIASPDNSGTERPAHYFDPSPTSASRRREFLLHVDNATLTLETESGVFSAHGLDKGTAAFLKWASTQPSVACDPGDNVCDLGCGSGPLALTLASKYPHCTVYAIDINERARQLCAENARRNGLHNVVVCTPEEVPNDISFSLLWSNPPIRIGKSELHALLTTWLTRLTPTGRAQLVVAKNLGADSLTDWLNEMGFTTFKRASSKGFRILEVVGHQLPEHNHHSTDKAD